MTDDTVCPECGSADTTDITSERRDGRESVRECLVCDVQVLIDADGEILATEHGTDSGQR